MPTPTKPPRLWLRPARGIRQATWLILDAGEQHPTGCGADNREGAERELAAYIARKHVPRASKHPSRVPVADALRLYLIDKAPATARPKETAARVERLILHFGNRNCDAVSGAQCRAFANKLTEPAARRALQDLRAALRHYHQEGFLESVPGVWMPARGAARVRFLSRDEAARLLWAAYRAREVQRGTETRQKTGRHIARFILVALYSGTRAGAVCSAPWSRIDLEAGVFHRKDAAERETKKRRPPVRLAPRLLAHMRRWRAMEPKAKFVVEWRGKPVGRVNKGFNRAVEVAGLRNVTPHVLRHTAATWLMQSGEVDMWQAAGYLGMTVEVLESVYGHHHSDYQGDAARAIGRKRVVGRAVGRAG